jgi:hypothetical protein
MLDEPTGESPYDVDAEVEIAPHRAGFGALLSFEDSTGQRANGASCISGCATGLAYPDAKCVWRWVSPPELPACQ